MIWPEMVGYQTDQTDAWVTSAQMAVKLEPPHPPYHRADGSQGSTDPLWPY